MQAMDQGRVLGIAESSALARRRAHGRAQTGTQNSRQKSTQKRPQRRAQKWTLKRAQQGERNRS
jgi:hypothetical protein